MATLGSIRWTVGYSSADSLNKVTARSIGGLNLDESGGTDADSSNAAIATSLIEGLMQFSTNIVTAVTLTEARGVTGWQTQ